MEQNFEEEDEVIYDKTSLLQRSAARPKARRAGARGQPSQLWRVLSLALLFMTLGIALAIPGPTITCFEHLTHAEDPLMSCLFAGRAGGILVASLLTHLLLDIVPADCLAVVGLLLLAVAHFLIPWSERVWWLVGSFALQGATIGLTLSAALALIRVIFGRRHLPYRHTFLFALAVGSALTPILVMPFQLRPGDVSGTPALPSFNASASGVKDRVRRQVEGLPSGAGRGFIASAADSAQQTSHPTAPIPNSGLPAVSGQKMNLPTATGLKFDLTSTSGPKQGPTGTPGLKLDLTSTHGPKQGLTGTPGPKQGLTSTSGPKQGLTSTPGPKLSLTSTPGPKPNTPGPKQNLTSSAEQKLELPTANVHPQIPMRQGSDQENKSAEILTTSSASLHFGPTTQNPSVTRLPSPTSSTKSAHPSGGTSATVVPSQAPLTSASSPVIFVPASGDNPDATSPPQTSADSIPSTAAVTPSKAASKTNSVPKGTPTQTKIKMTTPPTRLGRPSTPSSTPSTTAPVWRPDVPLLPEEPQNRLPTFPPSGGQEKRFPPIAVITPRPRPTLDERYHRILHRMSHLRPVQSIFVALGVFSLVAFALCLHLCCVCRRQAQPGAIPTPSAAVVTESPTLFGRRRLSYTDLTFLGAVLGLFLAACGLEVTLGNWLFAWARRRLAWGPLPCLLLTAAFWAGLAMGRLPLLGVHRCRSSLLSFLLFSHLLAALAGCLLLLLLYRSPAALWGGTALAGFGLGPFRGAMAHWLEAAFAPGELRWLSVLTLVATGAGEAVLPVATAFAAASSPRALFATAVGASALCPLLFGGVALMARLRPVRAHAPLLPEEEEGEEEEPSTAFGPRAPADDEESGFALRKLRNGGPTPVGTATASAAPAAPLLALELEEEDELGLH